LKTLQARQRVRKKQELTTMSSASSIPRASAEKIYELFGRRFLHSREATMTADPTGVFQQWSQVYCNTIEVDFWGH